MCIPLETPKVDKILIVNGKGEFKGIPLLSLVRKAFGGQLAGLGSSVSRSLF